MRTSVTSRRWSTVGLKCWRTMWQNPCRPWMIPGWHWSPLSQGQTGGISLIRWQTVGLCFTVSFPRWWWWRMKPPPKNWTTATNISNKVLFRSSFFLVLLIQMLFLIIFFIYLYPCNQSQGWPALVPWEVCAPVWRVRRQSVTTWTKRRILWSPGSCSTPVTDTTSAVGRPLRQGTDGRILLHHHHPIQPHEEAGQGAVPRPTQAGQCDFYGTTLHKHKQVGPLSGLLLLSMGWQIRWRPPTVLETRPPSAWYIRSRQTWHTLVVCHIFSNSVT